MVISSNLDLLTPVSLADMAEAKLMNRIDTKYLSTVANLERLLEMGSGDYMVLEIESQRRMPYYTRYFDTLDTEMYYEHERGRKARQKIRIRRYESSDGLSFLEVKDKNNKGLTRKTRIEIDNVSPMSDYGDFISNNSHYAVDRLIPQIENHFQRTTLVSNDRTERVTIDTAIEFHNLVTGQDYSLPDVVIIEWKRQPSAHFSPMKKILKELGIRESGFSKYCVGMAVTNPQIKRNRLKKKIRTVEHLCH